MKDIIAKILIEKIGRENVSKFIEDDNGDLIATATISIGTLAEEITDTLKKQGYGDTRQAVRDFAKKVEDTIEKSILQHPFRGALSDAIIVIKRTLAEVTEI